MKAEFLYDPRIASESGAIRKMTSRHGDIFWEMTPGTAPAAANGMYVAHFLSLASDSIYISLHFSANNEITLTYCDAYGNTDTAAWDCTASVAVATSYQCRLKFEPRSVDFYIDNVSVAAIVGDVDFEGDPLVRAFWGTDSAAANAYTDTTYTYPTMETYDYDPGVSAG